MANEFFEFIVLFLIAYIFFENFKQIEKLTMVLLVIAVAAALMAIIEYYLKKNLFSNISLPGIALDPAYLIQALSDKSRGGTYRSQAAFSHPLLLAEFCVFAIPIAFYFLRTESALNRIFGAIGIIAIPAAGITSGSRSALVAIGFVLLLSYALTAWRISLSKKFGHFGWFLYLLGFSILGLLVYFAIDSGLIDNLLFGQSLRERQSTLARIQMFETGIPAIQSAPFLGFGVGNAAEVTGFSSNGSLSIDSFFLSFILESGIPSIIFFLLLAFLPLTMATFSKQAIENVNERDLMASILIGVIGMLAVKSILSLNGNTYLIFIAAAFALRLQIKSQLNK